MLLGFRLLEFRMLLFKILGFIVLRFQDNTDLRAVKILGCGNQEALMFLHD